MGSEYTSIIFLFLFACFYASLEPLVVAITIVGLMIMYWSEKYILFNHCKKPIRGNNEINAAIQLFIFVGPFVYTIGSFLWTEKASTLQTKFWNCISLFISVLIIIMPYKKIIKIMEGDN